MLLPTETPNFTYPNPSSKSVAGYAVSSFLNPKNIDEPAGLVLPDTLLPITKLFEPVVSIS